MFRMRLLLCTAVLITGWVHFVRADVIEDLGETWKGKPVTLKVPDGSAHIKFDSNGERVGAVSPGIWATDAIMQVDSATAQGRELRIRGKRVVVHFDAKNGKFGQGLTKKEVSVQLQLPDVPVTAETLSKLLSKIFLNGSQTVTDLAPPYMSACLKGPIVKRDNLWTCEGAPAPLGLKERRLFSEKEVAKIGHAVMPPRVVNSPDPDYTEAAKKIGLQGTVVLWLRVDENGDAKDIQVVSPLGMGLDDQAVRAVQGWKFKPATRDGMPVAVNIHIEVIFRLY